MGGPFIRPLTAGNAPTPAPAPSYRWVDEKGVTQHSDAPPQGVSAQAIAGGTATPVPGGTLATPRAQKKVLAALVQAEQAIAPGCSRHSVLGTEALGRDMEAPKISERWVLDRCGEQVAYRVDFTSFLSVSGPGSRRPGASASRHLVVDENSSFTLERER